MEPQSQQKIKTFLTFDGPLTPATSLYVGCATEEEIDRLFEKLRESGQVLMPLATYSFSPKFGWVADRFGVSWQLNLEQH